MINGVLDTIQTKVMNRFSCRPRVLAIPVSKCVPLTTWLIDAASVSSNDIASLESNGNSIILVENDVLPDVFNRK